MKISFFFACILLIINSLKSQINSIEVEYAFSITTPQGESSTFFKTLKDNGIASIFLNKDTQILGTGILIPIDKSKNLGVYIDKIANKSYQYEPIFKKDFYILDDSITNRFQWKIHDSIQKNILGYNCKFATCSFRGRNYNAYFSEDLPFNSGPWKLTGLPGTILEAYTEEGVFKFEAYKISVNLKAVNVNNPYTSDKIIFLSFAEHKKLVLKKLKDYQMKVQSEEKDDDVTYSFEDNSIELLKEQ